MWSAHNGRVMGQPRTGRERLKIWTRNSWDRYDGEKLHFSRIHIVIVHSNNNNWENTLEKRKMKIKDESQRKSMKTILKKKETICRESLDRKD